jgi:hypothetical protein
MDGQSFAIIMMVLQSLIGVLGTVIFFMVKRLTASIDGLVREDKEIRELVHRHREDALKMFNSLGQEIYKMRERRGSSRGD